MERISLITGKPVRKYTRKYDYNGFIICINKW